MHAGPRGGRREAILAAGYECIAELGYAGATTARICERAGVSSGTFFHHFPTKLDLLVELIDHPDDPDDAGDPDAREKPGEEPDPGDPLQRIVDLVRAEAQEARDPHAARFYLEVAAQLTQELVAAALDRADARQQSAMSAHVEAGQQRGSVRTDEPPTTLARWVPLVVDGYTGRVAVEPVFASPANEALLVDAVLRLLRP